MKAVTSQNQPQFERKHKSNTFTEYFQFITLKNRSKTRQLFERHAYLESMNYTRHGKNFVTNPVSVQTQ